MVTIDGRPMDSENKLAALFSMVERSIQQHDPDYRLELDTEKAVNTLTAQPSAQPTLPPTSSQSGIIV